jgi:serpin B
MRTANPSYRAASLSLLLALLTPVPDAHAAPVSPETREVVAGNTTFALNLYGELKTADGDLFFSPFSISMALAMTYGGARGETAEQMAKVLQFAAIPTPSVHAAFGFLKAGIDSIQRRENVRLFTANALWPQTGYPFRDDYLDLLNRQYGASVTPLDYNGNKRAACQVINQWVEEHTERKITDLIRPDGLGSQTRLVLVNAIYFLGQWASPFKPRGTIEDTFHRTANQDVKCQMMHQRGNFAYAENPDLQIVELPYVGNELSMVILLPQTVDGVGALERTLSADRLAEWFGSLKEEVVVVQLPKFSQASTFSLAETLQSMGMVLPFERRADFSGMDGHTNRLFISVVAHKAYVNVNEEGTEAAAATAVEMMLMARKGGPEVPVFRADHPFLFLIKEKTTGSILFLGRVMEPKAGHAIGS